MSALHPLRLRNGLASPRVIKPGVAVGGSERVSLKRWTPDTLGALERALAEGVLVEDHLNDFKRELTGDPKGQRAKANRDLAGDLAAMAVHGGRIWIGVDGHDNDPAQPAVTPVVLAGLRERVEQIARSVPTPPLHVRFTQLDDGDGRGVLVVDVPWSADAPHMVGDRYLRRGQSRNEPMSDAEVRTVLTERRGRVETTRDLLLAELDQDPLHETTQGRMFVVAWPSSPRSATMLLDAADGHLGAWLTNVVHSGLPRPMMVNGGPNRLADLLPYWLQGAAPVVRMGAAALRTLPVNPSGRELLPTGFSTDELEWHSSALDLVARENGQVRLFTGAIVTQSSEGAPRAIRLNYVLGFTWHLLRIATAVRDVADYWGPWSLGLAITNAGDVRPTFASGSDVARPDAEPLHDDPYISLAEVSSADLDDRSAVVAKLCGRLCRGFNAYEDIRDHWRQ